MPISRSDVFVQPPTEYEERKLPTQKLESGHAKVLVRNNECFITEHPDKWLIDYKRRLGHKQTGYFARNSVPYIPFGNLKHIAVNPLIEETIGITLQKHGCYNMQMLHLPYTPRHECETREGDDSANTIVVVSARIIKKCELLPPSRNAGLSAIQEVLDSYNRVKPGVAAGLSFIETTKLEEERKYLKQLRAAKCVEFNHPTVSMSNLSFNRRPSLDTASGKMCLISKPPKNSLQRQSPSGINDQDQNVSDEDGDLSITPDLHVALAAAHYERPLSDMIKKRCQQRECIAKVKSVYAILCCLHNIKMKDLRSRDPLSFNAIKSMSQNPLSLLTYRHHHHYPSIIHHTLTGSQALKSRNVKVRFSSLVDTWDDLLKASSEDSKRHAHMITNPTLGTGNSPQTFQQRTNSEVNSQRGGGDNRGDIMIGGTGHAQSKPQRVLPPWQRQVVYVNKEDGIKQGLVKKLTDSIEDSHYFKSKMSQKIKVLLTERKDLQLQTCLELKMANLDLSVNRFQCLKAMREAGHQLRRKKRTENEQKPLWYVLLEKEVSSVFDKTTAPQETSQKENGHENIVLEKLKQFIKINNGAIPHVIEKLCLLFMSLPANHLFITPVFTALQFVAEYVLKSTPTICLQWWDIRQLPPIATELPDPAYLFGMHV